MERTRDLAAGIGFLVLALVGMEESLRLPLGRWDSPAPGLFPLLLSVILAALALALLVGALARHGTAPADGVAGSRRAWWTTGSLVAFYLLLEPLGFLVASLLLLLFLLRAIAGQRWGVAVAVGVGASVSSYLLFDRLLRLPLPRGLIGF